MNFAEKKVELFQIVADADEELTGKLIEFARQLAPAKSSYSGEELAKFHATRQKYATDEAKMISLVDAHSHIRSLKKK